MNNPEPAPNPGDLLPCPFCGSGHIVCRLYAISTVLGGAKTRRGKPKIQGWSVECLMCQASVHRPGHTEDSRVAVIERWNTRAGDPIDPEWEAQRKAYAENEKQRHADASHEGAVHRARDEIKRRNT